MSCSEHAEWLEEFLLDVDHPLRGRAQQELSSLEQDHALLRTQRDGYIARVDNLEEQLEAQSAALNELWRLLTWYRDSGLTTPPWEMVDAGLEQARIALDSSPAKSPSDA